MIILINGLQYTGYKKFEWGVVGETACADSWGRALKTGEPSLSLPCYAERRYGGVPDEEMLMALKPEHLAKAVVGMKALAKNGLRYPIPPYGIQGRRPCRHGRELREEVVKAVIAMSKRRSNPLPADGLLRFARNDRNTSRKYNMSSSKFDIVVYGATGFTGQLVAEYLTAALQGRQSL